MKVCDNCGHNYRSNKCKICSSDKPKLCKRLNCNYCSNRDFSRNPRSNFMLNKKRIISTSTRKYKFECSLCNNIFKLSPYEVDKLKKWCPECYKRAVNIVSKFIPNKIQDIFIGDLMSLQYVPAIYREDWGECIYDSSKYIFYFSQDYIITCDKLNNNEEWIIKLEQAVNTILYLNIINDTNELGYIKFIDY